MHNTYVCPKPLVLRCNEEMDSVHLIGLENYELFYPALDYYEMTSDIKREANGVTKGDSDLSSLRTS